MQTSTVIYLFLKNSSVFVEIIINKSCFHMALFNSQNDYDIFLRDLTFFYIAVYWLRSNLNTKRNDFPGKKKKHENRKIDTDYMVL